MHFSYSPSVQKCVSVKFIFNKIHYMNLWHFFCPLHFQALIDSTWKQCCSPPGHVTQPPPPGHVTCPRVTWRGPAGHVTPGHCSHVPQARRLTHPKTRSTLSQPKCVRKHIWRDLRKCQVWRWQDSQFSRQFQHTKVSESTLGGGREKPLWSAVSEKATTDNKRKRLAGHFSLWQRCPKMPDCLINETHNSWPLRWEGLRYLSALLFMRAILAGLQGKCPTSFLFIAPPSLTPTGCMYIRCLMSQWHQPKMLQKQDLAEYIKRRASTGTRISSYLAKPLPWQKKKKLTGTLANSNLHQAPFWFLCELEFPLIFHHPPSMLQMHTRNHIPQKEGTA